MYELNNTQILKDGEPLTLKAVVKELNSKDDQIKKLTEADAVLYKEKARLVLELQTLFEQAKKYPE